MGEKDIREGNGVNLYATYVEQAEGVDKLDTLQHHHNQDIYEKAVKILEMYFNVEEDAQEAIHDGGTCSFNSNNTPTNQGYSF